MPQQMSTASSGRERTTATKPSARSRQWPRVSAVSLCSRRFGMRATSIAEMRNETALIQYAASGPAAAVRMPPSTGPTAQLRFSTVWRSAFAAGSWSGGTRFGMPAYTAGRKKPVASPATNASATIPARARRERQRAEHARHARGRRRP